MSAATDRLTLNCTSSNILDDVLLRERIDNNDNFLFGFSHEKDCRFKGAQFTGILDETSAFTMPYKKQILCVLYVS